jgi:hypothetical protein
VIVAAPGRETTRTEVIVAEGASPSIEVRAGALVAGPDMPSQPAGSHRTAGWVVGGIGVVGLGVGVVAGVLTLDRKSTVDANCNADKRCNQAGYDAAQSGKTLGMITTAGLVAGAIGVGVGAYLLLSPERSTAVVAEVSPSGPSFALRRSW